MEITTQEELLGPLLLARSTIDRSALFRGDAEWLKRAWEDGATRVLVVDDGKALVRRSGEDVSLVLLPTAEAPDGERYLLGVDAEGIAYFAVSASLPGVVHTSAPPGGWSPRSPSPPWERRRSSP
ncbi:hypothetical protein ACFQX6_51105 [Streptosporangium lutulentum]